MSFYEKVIFIQKIIITNEKSLKTPIEIVVDNVFLLLLNELQIAKTGGICQKPPIAYFHK